MAEHRPIDACELDFEGWTCPLPLRDSPTVVMGHGGGGALSAELVEHLFLPGLRRRGARRSSVTPRCSTLGGARLAFSTDSYVVRPLFFPGGDIGDLAVNGTVNDLAMSGATPLVPLRGVHPRGGHRRSTVVGAGRRGDGRGRARAAGVQRRHRRHQGRRRGNGDGVYINTAGIGLVPDGVDIGPQRAGPATW